MRNASLNRSAPDRHDHEFLKVNVIVCMRAAVDDVHHRDGKRARIWATEITVERKLERKSWQPGRSQEIRKELRSRPIFDLVGVPSR